MTVSEVALGDLIRSQKLEPDLIIKKGNLVNVNSSEIYETSVAVVGDRIALISEEAIEFEGKRARVIEARGSYLTPGLIDFHFHVGPTCLAPGNISSALLGHGTTAIATDFYEYAATGGVRALRFALDQAIGSTLKIIFKVPMMALLQNSPYGNTGKISTADLLAVMNWEETRGLCEVQTNLLSNKSIRRILEAARARKLALCGHMIGFENRGAALLTTLAPSPSDHESVTAEEAVQKVRAGLRIAAREGSAVTNLSEVIRAITQFKLDPEQFTLCTDEIDLLHLETKGHVDYAVRKAIAEGVSPIDAIKMATLNVARFYHLESELGNIAVGRAADIVISKDLRNFRADKVVANGRIMGEKSRFRRQRFPRFVRNTIKLRKKIFQNDLIVMTNRSREQVQVNVILAVEGQITSSWGKATLSISENGRVLSDGKSDVLHVSLVERYGYGRIGNGFVSGFGLRSGAVAQSLAPVPENVISVGANTEDMALAFNRIARIGGGIVLANKGKILTELGLPILGIASEKPFRDVTKEYKKCLYVLRNELGCILNSPFLTLMAMADPHIPELKITEYGLVANATLQRVNPIICE